VHGRRRMGFPHTSLSLDSSHRIVGFGAAGIGPVPAWLARSPPSPPAGKRLRGGAPVCGHGPAPLFKRETPTIMSKRLHPLASSPDHAMRGGGNEGTVQAGEAERRSVLPRGQRWALLALLLCIYVHNQWSRNSILYAVLPHLEIAPNLQPPRPAHSRTQCMLFLPRLRAMPSRSTFRRLRARPGSSST
jgi:hypothetical protein